MDVAPVTVFVGPNNAGKSLALKELRQSCGSGEHTLEPRILKQVEFSGLNQEEVDATIASIKSRPRPGYEVRAGTIIVRVGNSTTHVSEEQFATVLRDPPRELDGLLRQYLARETLMLGGEARIGLIKHQTAGDLSRAPDSSFQVLFRDDEKRALLQAMIKDAFGMYLVVDPTHLGHLRLRLSSVPPRDASHERSLDDDAINFFKAAMPIEQASDGVHAFVGILTEIVAGDPQIVIIDEPEAFLHPALAFKLAREIARASSRSNKRLFVATHSPQFVMGCVQSGVSVNIVRLTYQEGEATARVLQSSELTKLMRNPLLRSTGMLSGLFYESVVVTESDADRAFYDEINVRLLRSRSGWGIPNCLFLNAQNKQTLHQLLRPLRELGIAAAGIVDVDVVKDGGSVWTDVLKGANVPLALHNSLGTLRAKVKGLFESSGKCMKRDGGTSILAAPDREAAESLFDQLQQYGVFVVRGGELESWLPHLKSTGHGPAWLVDAFEKMGEDPGTPGYVSPSGDDVWRFLATVREWLHDPLRKGIPC